MLKNLRLVGRIAALMYFLFGLSGSYAGQLEVVSVTSSGFGANTAAATVDAVRNGVASVNGESMASSQHLASTSISSTDQQTQKSKTIDDDIQQTKPAADLSDGAGVVQSPSASNPLEDETETMARWLLQKANGQNSN